MKKRLFLLLVAAILPFCVKAQYNASVHIDTTINACTSFTWSVNGETYTESGVHTAIQGDTLYILDLNIYEDYSVTVTEPIHGGCTFTWSGNGVPDTVISHSGDYQRTFKTVHQCDSTVNITLYFSGYAVASYTLEACDSLVFKNVTYNENLTDYLLTDSTLIETITDSLTGETTNIYCDSLITLNLTIYEPVQKTYDTIVASCGPMYFSFHPSQSPIYIAKDSILNSDATGFPWTNVAGRRVFHPRTVQKCMDSVVNAHIDIKDKVIETYTFNGCDNYIFENEDTTIVYFSSQRDSLNWGRASNGCDSVYIFNVIINKSPVVYISGDLRVLPGQAATLYANSDQNVIYTWYNGSSETSITTDTLYNNTDVSLAGKSIANGCVDTAKVTIMVTTEGIEGAEANLIQVYPNPTANIVNINSDKAVSQVTVFNINGQQVLNIHNNNTVDMHNLNNGHYVLRIELEDGSIATGTIVLKK